jgi:hypothetical protein
MSIALEGAVTTSTFNEIKISTPVKYSFTIDLEREGGIVSSKGFEILDSCFYSSFEGDFLLNKYIVNDNSDLLMGERMLTKSGEFEGTLLYTMIGSVFAKKEIAEWDYETNFYGYEKLYIDGIQQTISFDLRMIDPRFDPHPVPEASTTTLIGISLLSACTFFIFRKKRLFYSPA